MAEFSYNNSVSSTTKLSPFFANYGFNPCYEILAKRIPQSEELKDYSSHLRKLDKYLQSEITYAQAVQLE